MLVRDLIRTFRNEWIDTSSLEKLDKKSEVTRSLLQRAGVDAKTLLYYDSMPLWRVRGIGPSKAAELWRRGVRPDNLEKYRDLLPEVTLLALKFKPMERIPHDLVTKIADQFVPAGEKSKYVVVGSYRRNKPTSGDIDILYTGDDLQRFLDRLAAAHGDRWAIAAQGPSKIAGFFRFAPRRSVEVDIWLTDKGDKHAMMLFSTGSKLFNVRMRYIAKRQGYKLNQYGLWRDGMLVPTKSERDIFDKLGMRYRRPEERD